MTCAVVVMGLGSVSAQGSSPSTGARPARSGASKPFLRLFTPPGALQAQVEPQVRSRLEAARRKLEDLESGSARRFICGTPVLPADPAVDRGMVVPPDTRTRFSMRAIRPPC